MNKKDLWNQTLKLKSQQRDKQQSCSPSKILETILKMGKGRTSTNGLEDKKVDDDAQGLT